MQATNSLDQEALRNILSRHLPVYRTRAPHYQTVMLQSLLSLWRGRHERLLDIGGGTGVIAEAIAQLLPVGYVETIDVVDRFCPNLSVRTGCYSGETLPFADGSFDAATLNNVLHHVPVGHRVRLMREIRRVVHGALYIKDHVSEHAGDQLRLTLLDAIGNLPFGGMVAAQYLTRADWASLFAETGWRVSEYSPAAGYRNGVYAVLFPNRLEISLRLEPM